MYPWIALNTCIANADKCTTSLPETFELMVKKWPRTGRGRCVWETERHTYRETYIQRGIHTERHTYRETYIQRDTHTERHTFIRRDLYTERHIFIQRDILRDIHTKIHTYRETYIQRYTHTERHTYKDTHIQRDIHTCMQPYLNTYRDRKRMRVFEKEKREWKALRTNIFFLNHGADQVLI